MVQPTTAASPPQELAEHQWQKPQFRPGLADDLSNGGPFFVHGAPSTGSRPLPESS